MSAMKMSVNIASDFSFKDHCPQIFQLVLQIWSTTFDFLLQFLSLNIQKVTIPFLNIQ